MDSYSHTLIAEKDAPIIKLHAEKEAAIIKLEAEKQAALITLESRKNIELQEALHAKDLYYKSIIENVKCKEKTNT